MRRVVAAILACSAAMSLPALAAPGPLTTAPGNMGLALRFRYAGKLGDSGLMVQTTPTMVLVRSVAPDSPADLADLPSPTRYRVRLAAVDGRAIEEMALPDLLGAFAPGHGEVKLTVGRKVDGEYAETLLGPFRLPLSSEGVDRQRASWLVARKRFGEARALLGARASDELVERALLEAHDAAAGGDHRAALTLTSGIAPTDPLYRDAMRLRARVQESRAAEIVAQADLHAAQGEYSKALEIIRGVSGEGSWGVLRRLRETDWHRAMAARDAYRKDSHKRKAEQAAADKARRNAEAARREAERAAERERRLAGRRRYKH